jgi:hypothetical protein
VSAALLASLVLAFAPPPPPSEGDEAAPSDAPADDEAPPDDETPPDDEAPPDGEAPDTAFEQPEDVNADVPRDERYDPILPYGESGDETELDYAEETPPPPELDYADEPPEPDRVPFDQTHEREPPSDDAIARESDEADELGKEQFQGRQASPQRFAIEAKFGPYLPDVDSRYTGDGFGPYATIYGETDDNGVTTGAPRKALYSVLSFEWQFFHAGGPLSIGTTVGLFNDRADALVTDPTGDNVRSSADKTRFHVIPVTLLLGYRFELIADRFRVPLVPYARGGVAYGFWSEKKGGKLTTNSAGQKSHGGSFGWQVNLGLMLRLDFIERAAAVDLDRLTGINHTYLFGEWQFSRLNGFGSGKAMSVGDDTFLVGLAFEF